MFLGSPNYSKDFFLIINEIPCYTKIYIPCMSYPDYRGKIGIIRRWTTNIYGGPNGFRHIIISERDGQCLPRFTDKKDNFH